MSDLPPQPAPTRRTGLSPKEQKLQALRDKLAQAGSSNHPGSGPAVSNAPKGKGSFPTKKTAFQRKAT